MRKTSMNNYRVILGRATIPSIEANEGEVAFLLGFPGNVAIGLILWEKNKANFFSLG
jgi:hypothetical protein